MFEERLQPHDIEAEEAVIGSLLIDGESILKVAGRLTPADFYRDRNSYCYEACLALFERREAINQVTVTNELNLKERLEMVGGAAYLSHLVSSVPTSIHIVHYATLVGRSATMRRLIGAAAEIASIGYSGTADEEAALSQAENLLFNLRTGRSTREFVHIREVLDQFLEDRTAFAEPLADAASVIESGFSTLDDLLGGLQPSDLIILAARPSVGKSTLAVNMAVNTAKQGSGVGIFSLEMSREQLAMRILASEARVNSTGSDSGSNPATTSPPPRSSASATPRVPFRNSPYISTTPPFRASSRCGARPAAFTWSATLTCWWWTTCNLSRADGGRATASRR